MIVIMVLTGLFVYTLGYFLGYDNGRRHQKEHDVAVAKDHWMSTGDQEILILQKRLEENEELQNL